MALSPTLLSFLLIFLVSLSLASSESTLPHAHPRSSFLLPLLPRSLPKTTSFLPKHRRFLRRSDNATSQNARMRLHDDLLLNGYYTTRLWIGTPPQEFALIVDTGSTVTYVPCSTCDQCGTHQDPKFDPDLSSTYEPVKCSKDCNCDNDEEQCVYNRQYAEMSSSSGVLGKDLMSFGDLSELRPQRAVFGCENEETGDLFSQRADGIMGFGRGDLSVVDQLVEKGVIGNSFSLCYGGMDIGGGAMVLGGISPPKDMVFAKSDPVRSPYYNVNLKEIHVAGNKLALNPKVFDGHHGTVLDSGTTYAYLPAVVFAAFKEAIMKEIQSLPQITGPDPNFNDICFSGAESEASQLLKSFPKVDFVFGNGEKLLLTPENYLFRHSKVRGAYCLGVFSNRGDLTTLLGGIVVRNTLVTYDRENTKIGFWKTNCSELWERLHMPNSSDSPPPLDGTNFSTGTAPTLAPNEAPKSVLPEDQQIEQIIFEISFNISYNDTKPHLTELAEYIAPELDVYLSQVRLLNFTSNGNNSLLGWAIVPALSSDSISNTTAMSIIAKLSNHNMQLPGNFSSYQLVGWSIVPKTKEESRRQEFLMIILAIIVALICGLLLLGAWFVWRRRQKAHSPYEPVNVAAPEQELQPI